MVQAIGELVQSLPKISGLQIEKVQISEENILMLFDMLTKSVVHKHGVPLRQLGLIDLGVTLE